MCNETELDFSSAVKRLGEFKSSGASSGGIGRPTRRPFMLSPPTIRSTFIVLSGSNFESESSAVSLYFVTLNNT